MKRIIRFNHGIIGGDVANTLISILPQTEKFFKQRKQYYEYYFTPTEIELSLEDVDKISNEFVIISNYEELIINL